MAFRRKRGAESMGLGMPGVGIVEVNQRLVEDCERVVEYSTVIQVMLDEAMDASHMASGVVKYKVDGTTVRARRSIVDRVQRFLSENDRQLFSECWKMGMLVFRWVDGPRRQAERYDRLDLKKTLREVLEDIVDPEEHDRLKKAKKKSAEDEEDVLPERIPVLVPLNQIVLSCKFRNGEPCEFQAEWKDTFKFGDKGLGGASDNRLLDRLTVFCLPKALVSPADNRLSAEEALNAVRMSRDERQQALVTNLTSTAGINSHATLARPVVDIRDALLNTYNVVAAELSRPVAVSQQSHPLHSTASTQFSDVVETRLHASAVPGVGAVERVEEDRRRTAGLNHARTVNNRAAEDATNAERVALMTNASTSQLLRFNPGIIARPPHTRVIVPPVGDEVVPFPAPQLAQDLVKMVEYLDSVTGLVFGANIHAIMGNTRGNVTSDSIRHEERTFRHHVNAMRRFIGNCVSKLVGEMYPQHIFGDFPLNYSRKLHARLRQKGAQPRRKRDASENEDELLDRMRAERRQQRADRRNADVDVDEEEEEEKEELNSRRRRTAAESDEIDDNELEDARELLKYVRESIEIVVDFTDPARLSFEEARDIFSAGAVTFEDFVETVHRVFNLPPSMADNVAAMQEMLRREAKEHEQEREAAVNENGEYLKQVAAGNLEAAPPVSRARSIYDLQNRRRLTEPGALGWGPDPLAVIPATTDVAVLYAPIVNAGAPPPPVAERAAAPPVPDEPQPKKTKK